MSKLGERIKSARVAAGYTQKELAELFGFTTYKMVQNWERGITEPDASQIVQLCSIFSLSFDYLLGTTSQPTELFLEHMADYASLDDFGKWIIDYNMRAQLERCTKTGPRYDKGELFIESHNGRNRKGIEDYSYGETVETTFNCSIENRDGLEQIVNDYAEKYSPDLIMNYLISKALKDTDL